MHVDPIEAHHARRRRGDAGNCLQQRRLPGTARPDDCHQFAGRDRERDGVEQGDLFVATDPDPPREPVDVDANPLALGDGGGGGRPPLAGHVDGHDPPPFIESTIGRATRQSTIDRAILSTCLHHEGRVPTANAHARRSFGPPSPSPRSTAWKACRWATRRRPRHEQKRGVRPLRLQARPPVGHRPRGRRMFDAEVIAPALAAAPGQLSSSPM